MTGGRSPGFSRAAVRADGVLLFIVCTAAAWRFLHGRFSVPYHGLSSYVPDGEALLHAIPGSLVFYRMPLSVLAAAWLEHWPSLRGVAAFLACAGTGALTVALARALAPAWAPLAGVGMAFTLWEWAWRWPETPLSLMLLTTAGVAAWSAGAAGLGPALALAACVGASLLLRSTLAFLPPLLAAASFLDEASGSRRERGARAAILLLVPYLFLLPWIALNGARSGEFVPFEGGQASSNMVTGALGLTETVEGDWSALLRGEADPARPGEVLAWSARQAAREPGRYARAFVSRVARFARWNALLLAATLVAGLTGLGSRPLRRVLLMAAYFVAVHCLMSVEERYFLPLRPLLAAIALAGAARLARLPSGGSRRWDYAPAAAAAASLAAAALAMVVCARYTAMLRRGETRAERLEAELRRRPDDAALRAMRGLDRLAAGNPRGAAEDFPVESQRGGRSLAHWRAWTRALDGDGAELLALAPETLDADARDELRLLQAHALLRAGKTAEARARLGAAGAPALFRGGADDARRGAGLTRLHVEPGLAASLPVPPREKAVLLAEVAAASDGSRGSRAALADAWITLGRAAASDPDRSLARICLANAEKLVDEPKAARRLALAFQQAGEPGRAARLLAPLSARAPEDAALLTDLAVAEFLAGNAPAALKGLERALALQPGLETARASLAAVRAAGRPRERKGP